MPLTIPQLVTEIETRLPTNNAGAISAATVRAVLEDIVNNEQVTVGQILTNSGVPSASTALFGDGTWKTPSGGGGGSLTATGGDPGIKTQDIATTTFTTPPAAIRTYAYDTVDDNGGALFVRVSSAPANPHVSLYTRTSADGSIYLMMPTAGEINAAQFGAKKTPWLTRSNDILPALEAAQWYIIEMANCGILRVPRGTYYLSKTFNMRCSYIFTGGGSDNSPGGTWIQPDVDQTGIVINFSWAFGADGTRGWNPGFGYGLNQRIGLGGNVYRVTTAGITATTGTGPTGTGSGITDGSVVWTYERPLTDVEQYNGGADGAIVTNMMLYSYWDRSVNPYGTACGILGRARGTVKNVYSSNFSGHGIAFLANGDFSFPYSTGNCNFWHIDNVVCYYNGWSGIRTGHSDGNGGSCTNVDVSSNGWFGVDDNTFLGSGYGYLQSAYDGMKSNGVKQHAGMVTYLGRVYCAVIAVDGINGPPNYTSSTPDVNPWWALLYGSGTETPDTDRPTWSNTGVYEAGGAYAGHNANSRSTWVQCYVELGTGYSQFGIFHEVQGGLLNSSVLYPTRGYVKADGVFRYQLEQSSFTQMPDGTSRGVQSFYGAPDGQSSTFLWGQNDWMGNNVQFKGTGVANADYVVRINGYDAIEFAGNTTLRQYGTGAPVTTNGYVRFPYAVFGDSTNARRIFFQNTIPTFAGAQGDRCFNSAATVGQPKSWACTGGGTWVSEGNL